MDEDERAFMALGNAGFEIACRVARRLAILGVLDAEDINHVRAVLRSSLASVPEDHVAHQLLSQQMRIFG